MDQERKNLQSTNSVKSEVEVEEDSDFYPDAELVTTHELCTTITPFNIKIKGFSDIACAFPHNPSRGYLYVIFMYDYDGN